MNPCRPILMCLLAIWLWSPILAVTACTTPMGYIPPTNYELVKDAETIVLADALSFKKKSRTQSGKSHGVFKFKVLERLKGDCKVEFISIEGDNDIRTWGDPDVFGFTKGDHGPCNPTDYQLSSQYVLFLRNLNGVWSVSGPAFTRVNVLVGGTDAPWTQAVRQYTRISRLNDYEEEKAALHKLHSRALANDEDCPKGLVTDIDAHFKAATPHKSFSDLKALYDESNDIGMRRRVLWSCEGKQEAKELFQTLLQNGEWPKYLSSVCSYVNRLKVAGFHDVFASELNTNHNENQRRMLLIALRGSSRGSEQALMQKVLESVSKKEAELLGDWFVDHPSQKAINHFAKFANKDYVEESQSSFVLAAMGDTNVLGWAEDFVKLPSKSDWVGYYVFARSPLSAADVLARQIIQKGDSDRLIWLVQGYGYSKRSDRLDRIKDVMALKKKSKKLVSNLRYTLTWGFYGDKQAEALLRQLPVVESED